MSLSENSPTEDEPKYITIGFFVTVGMVRKPDHINQTHMRQQVLRHLHLFQN